MKTLQSNINKAFRAQRIWAIFFAASIVLAACGGNPLRAPTWTPMFPTYTPAPPTGTAFVAATRTSLTATAYVATAEFEPTALPAVQPTAMARYCASTYDWSYGGFSYLLEAGQEAIFYLGQGYIIGKAQYVRIQCHDAAQGATVEEFMSDRPRADVLNKVAFFCAASPQSEVEYGGITFDCKNLHPYGFEKFTVNIRPEGTIGRYDWRSDSPSRFVPGCSEPVGIREKPVYSDDADILILQEGLSPNIVWIEWDSTTAGFECVLLSNLQNGQKYQFWNGMRPEAIPFFGVAANGTIQNGSTLEFVRLDGGRIFVMYRADKVWLSNDVVHYGVPAP